MAPAVIQNLNDLVAALQQLTKNDSSAIKKAEKMLKVFLKNPANAPFLVVVLRNTSCDPAIRHHAALMLKKKVSVHSSLSSHTARVHIIFFRWRSSTHAMLLSSNKSLRLKCFNFL